MSQAIKLIKNKNKINTNTKIKLNRISNKILIRTIAELLRHVQK